jgi:hypothetical protein
VVELGSELLLEATEFSFARFELPLDGPFLFSLLFELLLVTTIGSERFTIRGINITAATTKPAKPKINKLPIPTTHGQTFLRFAVSGGT